MYIQDFEIKRGETFSQDIVFKENNVYINLEGYAAKSQIRPFLGSKELTAEFACNVTPELGKVNLSLTSEQTSSITPGIYHYDLLLYKDNVTTYYLKGKIIIQKTITEPPNV
jgi:hypothetical protein